MSRMGWAVGGAAAVLLAGAAVAAGTTAAECAASSVVWTMLGNRLRKSRKKREPRSDEATKRRRGGARRPEAAWGASTANVDMRKSRKVEIGLGGRAFLTGLRSAWVGIEAVGQKLDSLEFAYSLGFAKRSSPLGERAISPSPRATARAPTRGRDARCSRSGGSRRCTAGRRRRSG